MSEGRRSQPGEAEIKYRALFDQSPYGIVVIDTSGKIVEFNEATHKMLGYSKEEFAGIDIYDISLKSPEETQACIERLISEGKCEFEGEYKARNGEIRTIHVISTTVALSGRTVFHSIWHDVTEQKRAELALRLSEERLARAQLIAHVGDWEWDIATNAVHWSDELYRIYGYQPGEISPDYALVVDAMHPDSKDVFIGAIDAALSRRRPFEMDYTFYRKDGTTAILHSIGQVVYGPDGNPGRMVGIVQDITEQKRAHEMHRKSREFIRSILDTVDEAFIVVNADYEIVLANSAYGRQVGIPVGEITGKRCYRVSHQNNAPCHEQGEECAVRHAFEKGEPHTCVHKHCGKDGSILYAETKSYPIKDVSGNVVSAIEVINNITDRHLLEEQLLRTQKLEAVGLLAGGIAHDFNNLLQGLFGTISLAKMFSQKDGRPYQMLVEAEKALVQARDLTKQLLTFSKGGEPVKKVISLRSIIHDSVKFALSGSNVDYSFSIDDNLWPVCADGGQINQVMHNIVLNAGDAMPDGGTILIEVNNVIMGEKGGLPLREGKYVRIAVMDTGLGIPESHISRIFDPYFSTKQKGSGLGLTTSFSIVKKHGGLLDVKSDLGVGSTFFIYLPASEEKPPPARDGEEMLLTGKGAVLLMDDDEVVRAMAGYMIRSLGYEVDVAESGEEAIEKYVDALNAERRFDVVILDLTVRGGMGGEDTVKRMSVIDPGVRAIVSSGYSDSAILSNHKDYGFLAVLSKPYAIEELSTVLYAAVRTARR
jgi:PAS domain S-box-containing protein